MAHSAPVSLAPAGGFVSPALSQRAIVLAAIIAFHVLLLIALSNGLARTTLQRVLEPIDATVIDKPTRTEEPPPAPPPPEFTPPRQIDLGPPPDVYIAEAEVGPTITAPVTPDPVPIAPPQPRVEPIRLVGRNVLPNTEDYYPPTERRNGVEGATNVEVCVNERGKRVGDPRVTQSSGNARFDKAALDVARAGRYARAARGEAFVPNCYGFRIIFTMK
jgi:periplasmic protein TonB